MEKKIVGGVFSNEEEAVRAIEALENQGFKRDDFSVFAQGDDADAIGDKTDVDVADSTDDDNKGKKAGKGAGIGAGSGAVLGGAAGLGLLAVPGAGPFLAIGPIAAAIEGGVLGAGGGGLVGALTGAGINEEDAKEYDQYIKDGNVVVLVEADENQESDVYTTFRDNNTRNTHMYPDQDAESQRGGL
ncbi:general stress protein [Alkalicoccus daliensis]|uniref:Heat induced stress protein YflT n=1 Tax=Alkalicoccus daliensis TaxID=745820 RepID=A0A1H0K777_9BACI|nr:general stress protein [Alkalicoccus daliensis]SDO51727.1 Heat induced stress protein YflT [Alkalicoccus daliensis]